MVLWSRPSCSKEADRILILDEIGQIDYNRNLQSQLINLRNLLLFLNHSHIIHRELFSKLLSDGFLSLIFGGL